MFPEDDLKHIKLNPAFDVYILGFPGAESLRRESVVLDPRVGDAHTAEHCILIHVECCRTVNDVG